MLTLARDYHGYRSVNRGVSASDDHAARRQHNPAAVVVLTVAFSAAKLSFSDLVLARSCATVSFSALISSAICSLATETGAGGGAEAIIGPNLATPSEPPIAPKLAAMATQAASSAKR